MRMLNDFLTSLLVSWRNLTTETEAGQTLVEYGLIIALISIAAIAIMATVGTNVTNVFTSVSGKLHS